MFLVTDNLQVSGIFFFQLKPGSRCSEGTPMLEALFHFPDKFDSHRVAFPAERITQAGRLYQPLLFDIDGVTGVAGPHPFSGGIARGGGRIARLDAGIFCSATVCDATLPGRETIRIANQIRRNVMLCAIVCCLG